MNECRRVRRLLALRDADRSPAEQALVAAHIQACADCAGWARQCREQDALIGSLPPVSPSPLRSQQFLAQIRTERSRFTMFTQLRKVVNVAATVAFLAVFVLIANFLVTGSLPVQEYSPASNGEITGTPEAQASATPTLPPTPYSDMATPTPQPPPTPGEAIATLPPSQQWVTPMPEPEPYPIDISTWDSPDGQWVAQIRFSQRDIPPEGAVCEGTDNERPGEHALHITFDVLDGDAAVVWQVWDTWVCGLGYTRPAFLAWSRDSRHLFFTQKVAVGGDPPLFMNDDQGIWQVDLANGQVTEVPVPDGYAHTISPDERRIVYMSRTEPPELVIYDRVTESEQRVAFWDALFSEPRALREAGSMVWSPDAAASAGSLFFAARNGPMGDGVEFAVARLDITSLTVTPLIRGETRLIWPQKVVDGRLLVRDWNGLTWWIDVRTGEKTTLSCVTGIPMVLWENQDAEFERTMRCIADLPNHWWEGDDLVLIWESYAPGEEGMQLRISADNDIGIGCCDGLFFPMNQAYQKYGWWDYRTWAFFEARFASFNHETPQEKLVFVGKGQEIASPAWQRAIAEWARFIQGSLYVGHACASCSTAFYWQFELPTEPKQCAVLSVSTFGVVSLTPTRCAEGGALQSDLLVVDGLLTSDEWDPFDAWLQQNGALQCYQNGSETGVFSGAGDRPLSNEQASALMAWTKNVYTRITADQPGWPDAQALDWTCNQSASTEVPPESVASLDVEALRNAEYQAGAYADFYDTVQLTDGEGDLPAWPDDPTMVPHVQLMESPLAFGDLNGDALADAVTVLDFHAPGTTGHLRVLAVVVNREGAPYNVATESIGDRSIVEAITIQSGEVTIKAIVTGPDDPLMSPSQHVTWKFRLEGDAIIWLSDELGVIPQF